MLHISLKLERQKNGFGYNNYQNRRECYFLTLIKFLPIKPEYTCFPPISKMWKTVLLYMLLIKPPS